MGVYLYLHLELINRSMATYIIPDWWVTLCLRSSTYNYS
jgi:hypothetical protein